MFIESLQLGDIGTLHFAPEIDQISFSRFAFAIASDFDLT
jgi:hypothetical protein